MEKLFILWHSVKSLLRPGKSPSFIFNPISTSVSASLRGGGSEIGYTIHTWALIVVQIFTLSNAI